MACMERAWPSTKGRPWRAHRSAGQGPGEEPFDADHELLAVGRHGLEEWLGRRFQLSVDKDRSIAVQETDSPRPGVQIAATVQLMPLGVEAPEVSSSSEGRLPNARSPTAVCRRGGLHQYQPTAADGETAAVCSSVGWAEVGGGVDPVAERGVFGGKRWPLHKWLHRLKEAAS
jgi:hypothetical protein